ncbi:MULTISPECIES: class I SAM-dependent methyltransferase [Salimicrobium]|uniref:Site-specific DNA-methyltransferase (Adenine-specific) n=2 Tax=Salimicrobium TaxID=351195 RepID=A0ABY1KMA2_9BACI|nr:MULTISPECIES: class I SAM-dependent methyltransferase [Salimicrobium]SDX58884.1 site-specific DNA-methyltransferase (adenine-specific) [Salimicrobium album]SIS49357.1 site-specific DNA-methyltransferase (adenine-specific) [Salimicrobium salexigens]
MDQQNVEKLFTQIDEMATAISEGLNITYLEGVTEALDILYQGQVFEDYPEKLQVDIRNKWLGFNKNNYENEEIRKAIQLATLKGMKGVTQQQHLLTPDAVATFIGFLTGKLTEFHQGSVRLFDPVCGSGNLLTAILNGTDKDIVPYGSEVDDSLIQLAVVQANLQKHNIEFFHQDSLQPFLLEPVDIVTADLPVGYYPDDAQAEKYELKAGEGHSYAHHLLIEQSLTYLKEGGYGIFVVPNFLFESDQAQQLQRYLRDHAHIIGMLQLPEDLFKKEKFARSVFIVQKKQEGTKPPKQALLVKLPSFSSPEKTSNVISQVNDWFSDYHSGKL